MHYCGTHEEVMHEIFSMTDVVNGLDYDGNLHDLWRLCEIAPKQMPILDGIGVSGENDRKKLKRLMNGDFPKKRNVIYYIYADTYDNGKEIYEGLRKAVPD